MAINSASFTAYGNSYVAGDVIGIIIDADNGDISLFDKRFFHAGVILHRPVTIKMIGRDVQKHAN